MTMSYSVESYSIKCYFYHASYLQHKDLSAGFREHAGRPKTHHMPSALVALVFGDVGSWEV
jgi:hypothetical protein